MIDVKKIDSTLDDIISDLEASERIAIMDEYVFKEYFLPYFKGEVEDKDDVIRTKWIEYADGANKPVKVVDEKGEELFRVPPLLGSIDIIKSKEVSYSRINDAASREIERLPNKGLREHGEALDSAIASIQIDDHKKEWESILNRYKDSSTVEHTNSIDIDDEEEIIYE